MLKHRKYYKEISAVLRMADFNKRGQLAIFIIVAIAIVLIAGLLFLFRGNLQTVFREEISPQQFLVSCIEPEIRPAVELLGMQGSYREPNGYINYKDNKVQYLCYTDDPYETCVVQQPMTKQNFEKELNLMIKEKANQCVRNLISEYESRGFEVSSGGIDSKISIIPEKIIVSFNAPLTITKETSRTFQSFDAEIKSEIYDLLFIAQNIVEYEAELGDSASELYLQYYPDLKIEKIKLSDGTTIYKLKDVVTNEEFTFASRSLVWPAGYGLEEVEQT